MTPSFIGTAEQRTAREELYDVLTRYETATYEVHIAQNDTPEALEEVIAARTALLDVLVKARG